MDHCKTDRADPVLPRTARARLVGLIGAVALVLGACESSHILVGLARPPIAARDVMLYTTPPATPYEQIAILETSSKHSFALTAQGKTDAVLDRLRAEAAKLGANGVLLRAVLDQPDGSVGTGIGTSLTGVHGTVGVGWGTSTVKSIKIGRGVAIYVAPSPGAGTKSQ